MKFSSVFCFVLTAASVFSGLSSVAAKDESRTGMIRGQVVDAETKAILPGANAVLEGTQRGAASDLEGKFTIDNVPVGNYTIRFSYLGYKVLHVVDVIVKSNRITFINAELHASALEAKGVVVRGGYFFETEDKPTSTVNFSYEEIRRAAGSGGDVSRIVMSLPSIAKVNDQTNNLIVRGGSPIENGFLIDQIEIPNINHFPTQGSSGGPIGLINVDFIQDVTFHAGGFSSMYGDKLSSVMEITFREGNRNEFDGQLDLNFAGFGGIAEGPLPKKKGSWLFSARRSYLDFIADVIDLGSTMPPTYGDFQWKLTIDLNPNHRLNFLGVWGDDHNSPDKTAAEKGNMFCYGNQDLYERTTGLSWRGLWGKIGYSTTSVSWTSDQYTEDWFETGTGLHLTKNRSIEQALKFRNVNHIRFNDTHSIEFGVESKHLTADYHNDYAQYTDAFGAMVSALAVENKITVDKVGGFFNYIVRPFPRLTAQLGIREDYFSYNKNTFLSPRFSISYELTDRTQINGSTGLYEQNLPFVLLSQNAENKHLRNPIAVHYVLGIVHLLTDNTKLTLEAYQKDYDRFPMDPSQPSLFLVDELYYRYGNFFNHEQLTDNGEAYSRGVEIMLQKKLARDFYGLASVTYFRTQYKDERGSWRNRVFDNRVIISIEGGYKPNRKWEFSARWIYAGGSPYTPFNLAASRSINRAVLDKNQVNGSRYPAYHSLNIRFDRRFHFTGSNLIFYLSVWNAYNRKNIATYFWNEVENEPVAVYQWNLLPIFGLEYEF